MSSLSLFLGKVASILAIHKQNYFVHLLNLLLRSPTLPILLSLSLLLLSYLLLVMLLHSYRRFPGFVFSHLWQNYLLLRPKVVMSFGMIAHFIPFLLRPLHIFTSIVRSFALEFMPSILYYLPTSHLKTAPSPLASKKFCLKSGNHC